MKPVLKEESLKPVLQRLETANAETNARYPGESTERQPVHTVYGGAHLFRADSAAKLGEIARQSMKAYAPDAKTFARAMGIAATDPTQDGWLAEEVFKRVTAKLQREPVEDFRIDFEDGFGIRGDKEEDDVAISAAEELARGFENKTLPPFIGVRVKALSEEFKGRAFRTLDLFLATLLAKTAGQLPPNFVVTLPKIVSAGQVEAFVALAELLERALKLPPNSLRLEIMIETTQAIMNEAGQSSLPSFVQAGKGRVVGAHFGAYDYTSSCNITAASQTLLHPACDFARHLMQVAYAGQPVWLSDGATNVMPVGPHREPKGGPPLSAVQKQENVDVVHRAWRLNFGHVRHSLRNAFYQGWDLHPAQLPARYAACYSFFLDGFGPARDRLKAFIDKAAQASLVGDVFDDAATGQGLLNFFLKALNCGAISLDEMKTTGLSLEEIQSRSFLKILAGRRQGS